jgi:hypothetical protein
MRDSCLAVALRELEAAGVRGVECAHGSKHQQLRWRINGGVLRVYTVPSTPSDWRSTRNVRAEIRRLLREDGVITLPLKQVDPPPRKLDRITALERLVAELGQRVIELEKIIAKRNLVETGNGRAGTIAQSQGGHYGPQYQGCADRD